MDDEKAGNVGRGTGFDRVVWESRGEERAKWASVFMLRGDEDRGTGANERTCHELLVLRCLSLLVPFFLSTFGFRFVLV